MKRVIFGSICCGLVLASTASAQQTSSRKAWWPFGGTPQAPALPGVGVRTPQPLLEENRSGASDGFFAWASPANMFRRAEAGTESMFEKTRSTWKGMRSFGRRLLPFSSDKTETQKKQSSFFAPLLLKKRPEPKASATIDKFLSQPRPGF